MNVDLHTHTTASDGLSTPANNVVLAKKINLKAIAITDHDTINGIDEAMQKGEELGIEVIPGIEVSTLDDGQDIHILGYFINYQDQGFLKVLGDLQKVREKRNKMMISKLNELGIEISIEEVVKKVRRNDANAGRPHIAEVLFDKGIVKSMKEAFEVYLGKNGKAYVNPRRISPEEGMEVIKKADGIPVLAHPGVYDRDDLIERLVSEGLKGIEVFHPDHSRSDEMKYKGIADYYNIIATGGSDFHGSRNGVTFHAPIGGKTVSYDIVNKLKSNYIKR